MKHKKLSIRIVFPFVMSVSIAVCIISCMFLFSHYFSGYFQRDTIEKVSKQKKTLAQDLEAEIENINELINSIYYQDIRTYDTATEMFQREMEQRMVRESEVLYSAAIYDADGSSLWHSEKLPDRNKAEVKQEDWFQNAQKNIETIHYGEKKLVQPDKARYVYEISRYIEYVENGNSELSHDTSLTENANKIVRRNLTIKYRKLCYDIIVENYNIIFLENTRLMSEHFILK